MNYKELPVNYPENIPAFSPGSGPLKKLHK